jgi:hypothetical protein
MKTHPKCGHAISHNPTIHIYYIYLPHQCAMVHGHICMEADTEGGLAHGSHVLPYNCFKVMGRQDNHASSCTTWHKNN